MPTWLYGPLLSGQYNIPAIYVEVDGVYTNTVSVDAVRGAGRPEATFLIERIVEKAARETGHDPAEFRRKNFVASFPHQTPVVFAYDVGDYSQALDKALALADYKGVAQRKAASAAKGKHATVKISNFVYKANTLHVSKGTKVTWVNKDGAVHTATDKGVFNTKKIKHNKKKSITFNRKGTFKYICTVHPFMHGTIVVG